MKGLWPTAMKSAKRHKLQTNELADIMGHWLTDMRPYVTWVLVVTAAVVGTWAIWEWYSVSQNRSKGEAWRSFFLAMSDQDKEQILKRLETVATNYGDSPAGLWALVVAADVDLSEGSNLLFADKALAVTSLRAAADKYEQALKDLGNRSDLPLLRQRALFGLAQAKEALGEIDDALKYYKQVPGVDSDSILAKQATKRVELLSDESMKRWYFWFARQEPKPPSAQQPATGLPGSLPGLDSLSDFPDLGGSTDESKPDSTETSEPTKKESKNEESKQEGDEPKQKEGEPKKAGDKPGAADGGQ